MVFEDMRLNSGQAQAKYIVRRVSWWICTALARACWSRPLLWPDVWLPSALPKHDEHKFKQINISVNMIKQNRLTQDLHKTSKRDSNRVIFKYLFLNLNVLILFEFFLSFFFCISFHLAWYKSKHKHLLNSFP